MRRKPGGNGVEIRLEKTDARLGGNRAEKKDEREVRGNREGDVSNTIEERGGGRIEPWGTPEETNREEEVESLTTTDWDRLRR